MPAGRPARPIRVALVGQEHWSRHLASMLERHAPDLAKPTVVAGARAAQLLVRGGQPPDVLLRVGFRPGAATARGIAFDALWSAIRVAHRSAPAVFYWLGTDLLRAAEDAANGRLRRAFAQSRADAHLVVAPWHLQEMAALGIHARLVRWPQQLPTAPPSPLPDRLSVLTYIPDGRFDFYGGPQVMNAAGRLPHVPFRVLGPAAAGRGEQPPNVDFLGRVPTTDPVYGMSTVVLRLAAHDGIAATVLEGLVHGRHVVWSYPFPHVRHVAFGDEQALVHVLQEVEDTQRAGMLSINEDGRAYVLAEFNETRLTRELAAVLGEAAPQAAT